jgi:hypothetical protein
MKSGGWLIFIAAMGMMLGLLAGDISSLNNWHEVFYPSFVAGIMTHISAVIAAFVGGNLVPNMFRDRSNDISNSTMQQLRGTSL